MLETKLIVLCDYATVSREGKLSINGIFDEFRTTNLPGVLGRGFLVAMFAGDKNTSYKLKIKLMHESTGDSETVAEIEALTGSNGRANLVIELVGARFTKEGKFYLKIFHDDDRVGEVPLEVIHLKQAEKPTFKAIN